MGVLDRLRKQKPSRSPRGASGRSQRNGFLHQDEQNTDLLFPSSLRRFDEMYRTDPDVRRNVWMVANPIIGATWAVEPYGGDEAAEKDRKAAEFVEWALFENMTPNFQGHLAQALPVAIRSGFAPFEQIWTSAEHDGRRVLVPKTLALRLPRTIQQFNAKDEDLVELVQHTVEKGRTPIPMSDLVYYRFGAEGDNWEGISLLRAAYKPWLLKDKLERIDAIKQERLAVGIPICYPPENVRDDDAVLSKIEDILAGVRTAEQAYIVSPGPHAAHAEDGQGWLFDILTTKQGEGDTGLDKSLAYHTDKIAAAFLAEFMRLGQGSTSTGARATADVQQNPFLAAVEAIASELESVLNGSLVRRMVALNFDVEEPPKLTMSLVDSTTLTELADYVQKLSNAGALHADPALEDFLRERGDLPPEDPAARKEREEQARAAAEAMTNEPPPTDDEPPPNQPKPPKPSQPVQASRSDRALRGWEEQMALDQVENAIDGARARFEHAGEAAVLDLAKALGPGHRKRPPSAPKELVAALHSELTGLYRTGRESVRHELNAQRPEVAHTPAVVLAKGDEGSLLRRAILAANSITHAIWQVISNLGMNPNATPAQRQRAGEAEGRARLRAEAQLHAAGALNEGRDAEAQAHADEIVGSRYTSILDGNRCEECARMDDDVLRPLDDPVRLAHKPPNPTCFGGGRCRCLEFYQLADEAPASA